MSSLLARIGAFFVAPADAEVPPRPESGSPAASSPEPDAPTRGFAPPTGVASPEREAPPGFAPPARVASPERDAPPAGFAAPEPEAPASAAFAVVLGTAAAVVPVAAACAGELRARERAAAAVVCVWGGTAPDGGQGPTGATTPAARRLAARLTAHGFAASACGRLAWAALPSDPEAAAAATERCTVVADGPVVLAVARARPAAFEPLLARAGLGIAVLSHDVDDALRTLALATIPARASITLPPMPPGPPKWAAMAGLARLRSLPPEVAR
jgi:hypothetical protein